MRLLRILALIACGFALVAVAGWWWLQRDTRTLDGGVDVVREHQPELFDIIRAAEVTPDMAYAANGANPHCDNVLGKPMTENCTFVLKLLARSGMNSVAFQRSDKPGVLLSGADFVVFEGGSARRPVDAVWRHPDLMPFAPGDTCRIALPGWRVCPGRVSRM